MSRQSAYPCSARMARGYLANERGRGASTGTVAKPTSMGFDVGAILRSVDSPRLLYYRVGMPSGASLVQRHSRDPVRVVADGMSLGMVLPPDAVDLATGFQHRSEAERFLAGLRERFAMFGFEIAPEKTRLVEFGCYAAERRAKRGLGKPETFQFLGFTHLCAKPR